MSKYVEGDNTGSGAHRHRTGPINRPSFHRLHKIDTQIRSGTFPGIDYLAEMTEVHPRTIHRDLEYIRSEWKAPLKFDKSRKGYYYTEATWSIPAIQLSEQELLALLIAKNAILHYAGVPYETHLRQAFQKITEMLPDDGSINLGDVEDIFAFRFGAVRQVEPEILNTVSKALQNRRSLKINYYAAGKDEHSERALDPYLLDNLRGDWYLVGFCHLRQDLRVFSLNRIKNCIMLPGTFTVPADFSYREYIKHAFGILRSDAPVEIAVELYGFEARLARERIWHESQRIEEKADGSIVIHLRVTGVEEVKRWVLSSGKDARVLEPGWLAKELEDEHCAAAARYMQKPR